MLGDNSQGVLQNVHPQGVQPQVVQPQGVPQNVHPQVVQPYGVQPQGVQPQCVQPQYVQQPFVQPVVVQIDRAKRAPTIKLNYRGALSRRFGISQIVLCGLCIVLNIAGICIQTQSPPDRFVSGIDPRFSVDHRKNYMYYYGSGIWCSLPLVS